MKKLITIALVAALAACGSKKDKEAPKTEPPPVTGSAATGSAVATGSAGSAATGSAAAGSAVDVPTEMDFEQQAKTDITDKNVDTEVKKIEADLGK